MKSSYPIHVKGYLKAVPAIVMSLMAMATLPVVLTHINYVRYEHFQKPLAKSTPYERALRLRDERFRHLVQKYHTEQPKDALMQIPQLY